MSRLLFLDSGPLGLLTHPQRSSEVIKLADWLSRCLLGGDQVLVAAIVYYELKRELLRAPKSFGIARLDAFVSAKPGRYVPLSDDALRNAAELWAHARQAGQPTTDPKALDVDVILAAQALSFAADPARIVVATTNPTHLSRFLQALDWQDIVPFAPI